MTAQTQGMRIAVIGAGISGLAAAWLLGRRHAVTLYEAGAYAGGHTNTVDVELGGVRHPVDTGFLVFNDRTYPNLVALFEHLGVPSRASDMSFSVSIGEGSFEWSGTDLGGVFAQRANLASARFWGMLADILRFHRDRDAALERARAQDLSLGRLLDLGGYGADFRNRYLLPMAAAIWSSPPRAILDFPAETFLRFCRNHGLLQLRDRPQWRTVVGGGREYVRRLLGGISDLRLSCPVDAVQRAGDAVHVSSATGSETYDAVVLATHAPESLRLLADADEPERALLAAVRYQRNEALLHTDPALLPRRRRAWSAWNFLAAAGEEGARPVCVSYLLNRLQALPFAEPVVVTLNPVRPPAPERVLARFSYEHPLFDAAAIHAQGRLGGIQGRRRTWFAGAWTRYGFHEDGLASALGVAAHLGVRAPWDGA